MLVGITGSRGFIGRALRSQLEARGWQVRALPRHARPADVAGCDAIVNLAGESVDGRWTEQKKTQIERSRVEGTRRLVDAIAAQERKPRVLVNASAVGFYGDRGDEPLFESSAPGNDFLSRVCTQWEAQAARASEIGVRAAMLRTGIVIGNGGALKKMIAPFKFGAGGPLGSGRQFVPWIHIDDIVAMYIHAIEHDELSGPVNAVTPDYATSARFALAIGSAMRRPALAPAPSIALRVVLGEFADSVLAGALVIPARAEQSGFQWRYPQLEYAIYSILAPRRRPRSLHALEMRQTVRASIGDVFEFFSDARNLETLVPRGLRFRVTGDPAHLAQGSVVDYRLRVRGVPLRWKTMISQWNPPYAFADVQLHGPYALWEHRHGFEQTAHGTVISDGVTYEMPLLPFGEFAAPLVHRDLERLFAYRRGAIAQRFG